MNKFTSWIQGLVWLALAASPMNVSAQDTYPARPITLINPWAAGSSTDIMARAVAEQFYKQMGQSVVVVSRDPGLQVVPLTSWPVLWLNSFTSKWVKVWWWSRGMAAQV